MRNLTVTEPLVENILLGSGMEPVGSTPQVLTALVRSEIARWGKVIKEAGIREG
jgi:tripartite-type tricarboxylate transporter receptor subunit TctC